ncbi:MAG: hypothetical protein MMC23_002719 [Stictis urceolatum]|nr:hypothetical protein [Stictis urceolata]
MELPSQSLSSPSPPSLTIASLPLELHLEILRYATTSCQPIRVEPEPPSSSSSFPTLPPSISPLYTTPASLSLLPRYYSHNDFLLPSPTSLRLLQRRAGPHTDRIGHIAFDLTHLDTWYALISGRCAGLRKITLFDHSQRSFAAIYGDNIQRGDSNIQRAERSDSERAGRAGRAERAGDTCTTSTCTHHSTTVQDGPCKGYSFSTDGQHSLSDAEARRLLELTAILRPEISVAFGSLSADGTLVELDDVRDEELQAILEPLRARDPMARIEPERAGGEGGSRVKDWELLWEAAVMEDMKAWARGADEGMRGRLRREGWRVRVGFLRRLGAREMGRDEVSRCWALGQFEAWCAGLGKGSE